MTKGPWKYEKSQGHHHVLMGEESLDVNKEDDARAIAMLPELIAFVRKASKGWFSHNEMEIVTQKLLKKLDKKSRK